MLFRIHGAIPILGRRIVVTRADDESTGVPDKGATGGY
jgi:hypothetical protein